MTARKTRLPRRLEEAEDQFVGLWRQMSALWGVSPTMAEIHGLLYITGDALSMDDLMGRLGISRGNVSMNLGKLTERGLVHKVHKRGDRKEYYESLDDVWEMVTLVANQRKRRENTEARERPRRASSDHMPLLGMMLNKKSSRLMK